MDENITIDGKSYPKETVVAVLASLGVTLRPGVKDATVIKRVNELSAEERDAFNDALHAATVSA